MAKRKSSPIDIAAVEAELTSYWSKRDGAIDRARKLRYLENQPNIPAKIEQKSVVSPIAATVVDRVTGMLTTNAPVITVPPGSQGAEDEKRSSTMERWLNAALIRLARQARRNVLALFVQSLVQDGHGCMRLMHAPQLWHEYPQQGEREKDEDYNRKTEDWKKGRPLPVSWAWCDPKTVFPRWDELGLFEVLESGRRPALTVADNIKNNPKRYNRRQDHPEIWQIDRGGEGTDTVKFQQLWRREGPGRCRLVYAVDDMIVHDQVLSGYSQPPYIYHFGLEGASTEPDKMGLSVLYGLFDLLPAIDELLTQRASAVRLTAYPSWMLRVSAAAHEIDPATAGPQRVFEKVPGTVNPMWNDEELLAWPLPPLGNDIDKLLSTMMALVQQATLPPAMYGDASSGDSGYAINQLISAARVLVKPIIESAQNAVEEWAQLLADIVEYQVGQKLYVYHADKSLKGWVGLDAEVLNGYRNFEAQLLPLMPSDEYAKTSMYINLVDAGLMSLKTAREKLGIEQPDEEQRQIDYERFRAMPQIQAYYEQEAVKRITGKSSEELTAGQMRGQLAGLPPEVQGAMLQGAGMAGQQGMPQGAPQGMGMPPGAAPMGAPQGGGPVTPEQVQAAVVQLQQTQAPDAVSAVAQVLSTGAPAEVVVAALVQMGMDPAAAQQVVAQAQAMMQGGAAGQMPPQGGMAPQVNQPPPVTGGSGAIQSAPGVQAVPSTPRPKAMAGARPKKKVGRTVKPSGVASGRAPGVKREG